MDEEKSVIAVDLHGVLFRHNYKKMLTTFLKSKKKTKLLFTLLNPFIWIDVIRLVRKKAVAEEFLVGLAEKHKSLKLFVPLGIEIANQQKPMQCVINILKKLKNNGHKLHLFSNIGSIVFTDLQKKFPEIFRLFESFTIPSKENGYQRKPDYRAFKNLFENIKNRNHKIILIDDKIKNTQAAKLYGVRGIFFKTTGQLIKELSSSISVQF